MHVYEWPINAKLASSDWDQRRKDSSSSHGRQYEGGEQVRRTRDSSSLRGAKGSDFLTFVPNSDRSYAEVVYGQSYDPSNKVSEDQDPVEASWVKHQLGLQKDDLNSNPSSRKERANSLEGEGAASIHSLLVKDMGNRGVGRKIKKEVRDKSPSLDLQSNQKAWK
ncbi:hypothetical protein Q3G72_005641 [Acer saccharum]|nr:hypothetical protein Q3G72_005641 [Acer saccharum]